MRDDVSSLRRSVPQITLATWSHCPTALYKHMACNKSRNCTEHAVYTIQWRHDKRDGVSDHQPLDCLLNRLFRRISKKTSKLCVTGLCLGNSPVTGELPAQKASYAENISIWWRHHDISMNIYMIRLCQILSHENHFGISTYVTHIFLSLY